MKRVVRLILCVLVVAVMTGCGGNSGRELDLSNLKNVVGEFQFPELAWGSNLEQVENTIGCSFETMSTAAEHELVLADVSFRWMDVKGDFFCEFGQNGLDRTSIKFKTEEGQQEQFWNGLVETLTNTYGVVEPLMPPNNSEMFVYLWETTVTKRTALTITKSGKNISLDIYIIPTEKIQ